MVGYGFNMEHVIAILEIVLGLNPILLIPKPPVYPRVFLRSQRLRQRSTLEAEGENF